MKRTIIYVFGPKRQQQKGSSSHGKQSRRQGSIRREKMINQIIAVLKKQVFGISILASAIAAFSLPQALPYESS